MTEANGVPHEVPQEERYIGDGLYASFDGWHVVLRAPREGGDHFVALEPPVFKQLCEYFKEAWKGTR